MTTPDMIVSGVAIAWSIGVPFFPDSLFQVLDGMIGVFVLLVVALLAIPYGPLAGVLTLVAVALTFVERNRRKVATKLMREETPTLDKQLAPSPPMSGDEVHPEWETSETEKTSFYPEEEQSNSFEPVDSSINEKSAIPTIGTNTGIDSATKFFISQHLANKALLD